jgi:hypothetical protein
VRSEGLPTIAGYRIEEQIGAGGFSRVYRAVQLSFRRPVAIKVLRSSAADEQTTDLFFHECRVMGMLPSHPNIVTVHDIATTGDGQPCIVMALYRGTFRSAGRRPVEEVLDVGAKIARALGRVHDVGIVHRDIKPHNVFVSADGEPALADFGIAALADDRDAPTRYTLKYAPPELLRDLEWSRRGDIYSLGATLHQLVTGRVPFDGDDDEAIVRNVMTADPPPLGRSDAPPELERLLRRCMAKRPADRPADAGDVAAELERIVGARAAPNRHGAAPSPVTPVTPVARVTPVIDDPTTGTVTDDRRPGRLRTTDPGGPAAEDDDSVPGPDDASHRRLVAIVAAVLLAIVVGAVAIALSGGSDEAGPPPSTTSVALDDFVVLSPPERFEVARTATGFRFDWAVANPGGRIQIHRVGTDDNVIADESPFEWTLPDGSGDACFEARSVDADRTRLSQSASGPVCAD